MTRTSAPTLLAAVAVSIGLVGCGMVADDPSSLSTVVDHEHDGDANHDQVPDDEQDLATVEVEAAVAIDADVDADVAVAVTGSTTDAVTVAAEDESPYLGSYELIDDVFGTITTVTVADGVRTIESNSIPNHETGEFPNSGNPNEISEQSLTFEFTTNPEYTGEQSFAQTIGVAANGITFEPATAETATCSSGETYRIEALQDLVDLGLDVNNAHVQPNGQYHYHGVSDLLVGALADGDDDLVHVGFAADGFLIYYSMSGAYESGYELSTDARTGADCIVSGPGGVTLQLEGTTPDGTYTSDWVWSDDAGDLDECNGTVIDGEYAYLITDEYPYIGRCLNGADISGQPGPGGDGAPPARP